MYYATNPSATKNRCPTWVFLTTATKAFEGSEEVEESALVLEDIVCIIASLIDQVGCEMGYDRADGGRSELDLGPSELLQSTAGNEAERGWIWGVSKSFSGGPEEGRRDRLREWSHDIPRPHEEFACTCMSSNATTTDIWKRPTAFSAECHFSDLLRKSSKNFRCVRRSHSSFRCSSRLAHTSCLHAYPLEFSPPSPSLPEL